MQVDEPESLALTTGEVMTLAVLASERNPSDAAHPSDVRSRLRDDDLYTTVLVGSFNGMVRLAVQVGAEDDRFHAPTFDISPNVWRFLCVREALTR